MTLQNEIEVKILPSECNYDLIGQFLLTFTVHYIWTHHSVSDHLCCFCKHKCPPPVLLLPQFLSFFPLLLKCLFS